MNRSACQTRLLWCVVFASGVLAGVALSRGWPLRGAAEASARQEKPKEPGWLTGTTQERFARVEKHLRGLDVSMAEIGGTRAWAHSAINARLASAACRSSGAGWWRAPSSCCHASLTRP